MLLSITVGFGKFGAAPAGTEVGVMIEAWVARSTFAFLAGESHVSSVFLLFGPVTEIFWPLTAFSDEGSEMVVGGEFLASQRPDGGCLARGWARGLVGREGCFVES